MHSLGRGFPAICLAALMVFAAPGTRVGHAEDAMDIGVREEDGVTIYEPEFFAPYNPTHAKNMLERVPGAAGALTTSTADSNADDRRGLRSQTTQILINGKRLTTKGNSIQDYFERIPAEQVERIEVIVGNVRAIDADVGSRVINVVLSDTGGIGGTWSFGDVIFTDGQHMPTLAGSISGETGAWSYTLSAETRPRQLPRVQEETFLDSGGVPFIELREKRRMDSRRYIGRGRVAYALGPDHQIQVSGFVEDRPISRQRDQEFQFDIAPDGTRTSNGGTVQTLSGKDLEYEITGDYTVPLTSSLTFNGLFVYSVDEEDRVNDIAAFATAPESAVSFAGDTRDEASTEKILRGTVNWAFAKTQSLEVGVEGAKNSLDKTSTFFGIVDGVQVPINFFNADQSISEDRVEPFVSYSWRPLDGLEIETGVAAEFSWLDQTGSDVDTRRSFQFAKPSLDIYYAASGSTQLFASIRRDVGQLEFDDFVANLDRDDDEIDAGNPELAPEKSWDFEIGGEHRLGNDAGVVNVRLFYRDVSDVSDQVPINGNDAAPGNLGSGRHYGIDLDASLQLRQLGLFDGVISATFLLQDSQVVDPFTGTKRRFANQPRHELTVDARHDVKAWNLSYGFVLADNGPTLFSDFNTFEREDTPPDLRVFVERTFSGGWVGRLFWGNALRGSTKRTRTVFVTSQTDGTVARTELRSQKNGGFYGFSVRGTF